MLAVDYLPYTFRRAGRQWVQDVALGPGGTVLDRGPLHRLVAVRASEIERTGYHIGGGDGREVPYRLFVLSDVSSVQSEASAYQHIRQAAERLGFRNTILWSYLPTFSGYLGAVPHVVSVFDAVDNWVEHAAYASVRERLRLNYETIRRSVDVVFATSPDLVRFFDRPQATFVPNGVDIDLVASVPNLVGRDIAKLPRPIVGYVGTLQADRIDVPLLESVVAANPRKSFVVVGSGGLTWPSFSRRTELRLPQHPNLHLVGRKSFRESRAYVREFAVGTIPHLVNEFNRYTNPMKLYEYLAAGKHVVATRTAGFEQLGHLVHLASTPDEFNEAVLQALQEHSSEQVMQRQAAAREHSWQRRLEVMLGEIDGVLATRV